VISQDDETDETGRRAGLDTLDGVETKSKTPAPNVMLLAAPAATLLVVVFGTLSEFVQSWANEVPHGWGRFALDHAWIGVIGACYGFSFCWALQAERYEGTKREELVKVAALRAILVTLIQLVILALLGFILGLVFFMPTL
jgi:hypothetical protein